MDLREHIDSTRSPYGFPAPQGLYDPRNEKDSCGVGFVCDIGGKASHSIVERGIEVLNHLLHRGAAGADAGTGDGAVELREQHRQVRTSFASAVL